MSFIAAERKSLAIPFILNHSVNAKSIVIVGAVLAVKILSGLLDFEMPVGSSCQLSLPWRLKDLSVLLILEKLLKSG